MRHKMRALAIAASLMPMILSGCVAALVPIAAGGVIAKTQLDGRKRAKAAEASVTPQRKTEQSLPIPIPLPIPPAPSLNVADRLLFSAVRHPYLGFTLYALERREQRILGMPVRSSVLVRNVSLADPKTIDCGTKPVAVIIDLDESNRAENEASKAGELAILLETLREADIRIAWLSADFDAAAQSRVNALQSGDTPAFKNNDLVFAARKRGPRKQELRWTLAKAYCVLAIAGDTKSDFDELYDYLREPDLAIRLDAFINRG